jgi:PqqD family protein of HPr-rel-A system
MSRAPREHSVWLVRQQGTRLRRFDTEALAFNPLTWETHLLIGRAVPVLARLLSSPASLDDLVRAVAAASKDDTPSIVPPESVSRVLEELRDLGLIVEMPEASDAHPRS